MGTGRGRGTYRHNLELTLTKERIIGLNTERVSETMEAKGHVNKAVAAIHSLYSPLPLVADIDERFRGQPSCKEN